jgi:hypothetical protein
VVGAGQPAPIGGIFARFAERVSFNDRGQIVFVATLRDARAHTGVFLVDKHEIVALAEEGGLAPGGGRFAQFGPWAALDGQGRAAFVASLDGGAAPLAIFTVGRTGARRVVAVGEDLGGGQRIAALPLYPVVSSSSDGRISFAVLLAGEATSVQAVCVTLAQP